MKSHHVQVSDLVKLEEQPIYELHRVIKFLKK
jgi:hypothetical protein